MTGADLEVDFWDVGQGDCSVIKLPGGRLILIDVGPRGCPLIEWLREGSRRSAAIEAVILTHNDADHTGSLPVLIQECRNRIGTLWMLQDRPKADPIFQKTFRAALEGEREGCYRIETATRGQILWSDRARDYTLRIVHPSFTQNILAADPNDTSAVIVLEQGGRNLITWPGDLQLRTAAAVLIGQPPTMMMGPHHGGPSDYPTKATRKRMTETERPRRMQEMRDAAAALKPEWNFVSVGSRNSYHHPRPGFLRLMASQGARVICSQLTVCCDRRRLLIGNPVFEGAGALGLRSAKSGVSCRGAMRIYVKDGMLHPDEFAERHLERVRTLYRPQCLRGAR